ncbi:uncharacterized protein [Palaemon carinicauda]|uniref:uncharacterized protein n=1 Tax=Palaemon carinicauda TaxID=392227 RepID=UPI0035B5BDF1
MTRQIVRTGRPKCQGELVQIVQPTNRVDMRIVKDGFKLLEPRCTLTTSNVLECDICSIFFLQTPNILECDICSFFFLQTSNVLELECQICTIFFLQPPNVLECDICSFFFLQTSNVLECQICTIFFLQTSNALECKICTIFLLQSPNVLERKIPTIFLLQSSNILECDICCNAFSEEYCPRLLPCSHTLCGHCIDGIIATNRKFCPSCRKEFAATSAEDLTVNRIFLDLIIQLSSKPKVSNASSSREPKASIQGREPKASIQSFNEGFRKNCIKKGIKDYEETKAQVADAIETYRDMKFLIQEADKDIDGLMETLKGIKMSHSEMLSNIDQNIELMENALDLAFQSKIKLENFDAQLASSADFTSAGPVIDEAETVFNEIQEKIRETQDLLKCKRDADIGKLQEILNTKINLDNIVEEMKRRRIENDSQVNIKPSYLRSYGSLLGRIDPREIFVVKGSNRKQMVAQIDIGANRVASFTRLRKGTLPPRCFILKPEDFLSMPSRRGFLDVSRNGTFLGRVIIKVIDEGNLALNFLHQCAGDLGSSYVNSLCGRSFDTGNGVYIGGPVEAVLPGVDWQEEEEKDIYKEISCKVGQVTAAFSNDIASMLFIITENTGSWIEWNGCFGVVEEGLDVLRKAKIYFPNVSDVQVVDCGLMLSL